MSRDPVSPSPVEDPLSKQPSRLWLLLIAHVILGLFFSTWWAVEPTFSLALFLLVVPIYGFVLSQASLLAFWVAFSPAKWWIRMAVLTVGIIYLELLLDVGGQAGAFAFLATISASGITAVLGLVRWLHADLRRFPDRACQPGEEGSRFSIRGLLLFTFGVAVTIVGAKALREVTPEGPNLFVAIILSSSFIVVGLAAVWSGLGLARPTLRIAGVLLMSAVFGALLVYALNLYHWTIQSYFLATGNPMVIPYFTASDHWAAYLSFMATLLLQAGVLIASLLVVRSCGYRLVRKSTPDVELLE